MSNWKPVVITQKGIDLQTKVEAGAVLRFTKIALGRGAPADLSMATELADLQQNLSIASKGLKDNTCVIYGTGTNANVQVAYKASELGLFAEDPDEGEILYAVTTDDTPDTIPENTSATIITQRIGMAVAISASSTVSVVLSTTGFITASDAENIANDVMTEHKIKNPLDHPDKSVTEAKLADKAVSSRTLADKSVTETKLADSGVTAGTYTKVTVDRTGRVTKGEDYTLPTASATTLGAVKVGSNLSITNGILSAKDTTYSNMTGATASAAGKAGLVPAPGVGKQNQFLRGDGTWQTTPDTDTHWTSHLFAGTGAAANAVAANGSVKLTVADNSTVRNSVTIKGTGATAVTSDATGVITINSTNSTYSNFVKSGSGAKNGLVPSPGATAGTAKYLREDATWQVPPNTNNIAGASLSANGYIKFNNGLILQWGKVTDGRSSVTFPVAFASAVYAMSALDVVGDKQTGGVNLIAIPTLTGFTAKTCASDDGSIYTGWKPQNKVLTVTWWAIGK